MQTPEKDWLVLAAYGLMGFALLFWMFGKGPRIKPGG